MCNLLICTHMAARAFICWVYICCICKHPHHAVTSLCRRIVHFYNKHEWLLSGEFLDYKSGLNHQSAPHEISSAERREIFCVLATDVFFLSQPTTGCGSYSPQNFFLKAHFYSHARGLNGLLRMNLMTRSIGGHTVAGMMVRMRFWLSPTFQTGCPCAEAAKKYLRTGHLLRDVRGTVLDTVPYRRWSA